MTATNEKLSESDMRYNYLIGSIPDVVGELNLDGTIGFVSPQVYDMLGYHPDEMIGTNVIKFIHLDDVPVIRKAIKKDIKSKEFEFPNLRFKHKKGNYILVFAKGKLIKLKDKARLIGVIKDVTKLTETEKKLEESQDIFEQLNEVFLKFKEDPIINLQLLINAAGLLLNADCALFNVLKRVNGKEVLESLVTYNIPSNFTRESDAKGHICTDIIKDNSKDVVILSNLNKTKYAKTDENVRNYDLKQYVSYVVRFNNNPVATFCVVYTENREMSNNNLIVLQILAKSASAELARWNYQNDLNKSEDKYSKLINNLTDILLELDIKGITSYVSPQCYNILGYQPAEIIGKNVMGFIHPDDVKLIAKAMKQAIKTKEVVSVPSYRLIHKNGEYIYASANGRYVKIGGDERFIVAIRDERESKNLEKEVLLERDNLINILGSMEDGVYIVDRNYDIEYVNPILTNEFGPYEGKKCYSYFHDREKICPWCKNQEVFKGKTVRWEWYSKKNQKTYDLIDTPLKNIDGSISKLEIFRDITDRKKAEQELQESEEKYKSLFEQFPMAILLINFEGVIEDCNTSTVSLFGYTKEELLGIDYLKFDIFPPDTKLMLAQSFSKFLKTRVPEHSEIQMYRKDGRIVWINSYPIQVTIDRKSYLLVMVQDITERKKTEHELVSTKNELSTIYEQTPSIIILVDSERRVLKANRLAVEFANRSEGEILGLRGGEALRCLHSLDDPRGCGFGPFCQTCNVRSVVLDTFETNLGKTNVEASLPFKIDGKEQELFLLISTVPIDLYKKTMVIVTIDNITERKIAEQNLKESEERYRSLIEDAHEGVWVLDENENTTFVNPRMCEMLGYTKNEMIDKNLNLLIPDSMKERIKGNRIRREKGIKETYDLELVKKDGTIIYTNINAAPIMSESGDYNGSFAYITDITTQKQAEDTLRESEEKYRSLANELESILDHLPLIIAHKDDKNTLLRVNKYYADSHNLKKEDMEGKNAFDLYPHDQAQAYLDDDLEVIKSGKPKLNYIEPWESKEGSRWVNTSKIPYIDEEGNIKGIIAIVNDITEKKEIEEMKTYLLTRFSHEFKTPLVSIKGFSDFLLSEYKNKLDDKMIRFLEKIKEGGDKLTLLVNTFIQSSQMGEKLTRLKIGKENLTDLIKLGVSEMQGLIHLRKHTINVDIPDKMIGEFDKEQIYSVITNLLLNAIKYTPPGGNIFIHSKIEEGDIFFSIKDNGIGLTEEDKRRLFKSLGKIERYGNGWDIVTEGMGVGLYLSKEMISLHGGKIWVESEGKNKGSTFYFSIPMTNN